MGKIPDPLPASIGGLLAPVTPAAGSGWEVFVISHSDFYTRVAQLSRYTSLTFAKILKDKGSGTVIIPMDDPNLFPQGQLAINPNPYFSGGGKQFLSATDSLINGSVGTWAAFLGSVTYQASPPHAVPAPAVGSLQCAPFSGSLFIGTALYSGILGSTTYTFVFHCMSASTSRTCEAYIEWWTAGSVLIGQSTHGTVTDVSSGWRQITLTVTSPSNAAKLKFWLTVDSAAETHYWTLALISLTPTGYGSNGGAVTTDTATVFDHPVTAILTPNGVTASALLKENAAPQQQVIPLQQYTVTAWVYSPGGYSQVTTGADFRNQAGTLVQTVLGSTVSVPPASWTRISQTVQAPAGCYLGNPVAAETGTPAIGNNLLVQDLVMTYESGSATLGDFILDYEHLMQVWEDGVLRFEFLAETVTEQQADESEQRLATITGPGTAAVLAWALALPPGFPDIIFKTDSIADGFAEIDQNGNPVLDVTLWNLATPADHISLNPLGTCQLVGRPGTTYLGSSAYDITSSSVSAQVTPITGKQCDGSQVTQLYVQDLGNSSNYALIGLSATTFYCQVGDAVGTTAKTKKLPAYDPTNHSFWRISEDGSGNFVFWTSSDGVNWLRQWTCPYQWKATNLAFFFSAHYDTDNAVFASITSLNSEIVTPSSAGNIFPNAPVMAMWYQLLKQAQARGTIPWVTTRMNTLQDSFGNPWTDGMSAQIGNGTDMFSLLGSQAGIVNADWVMQPGFNLQVGLPVQPAGVSLGRDLSSQVIVRESQGVAQKQRVRARDKIANTVGAVNSDGRVVTATDANSVIRYWVREGWVQTAQSVNPTDILIVVNASLAATKSEELTATVSITIGTPGAPRPFTDFDVGDWVGLERANGGSTVEKVRVVGITPAVDANSNVSCDLTIYTYRQFMQAQLQYLVNKFGGQFVYSLGTTPVTFGTTGTGSPPTYIAPSFNVDTH